MNEYNTPKRMTDKGRDKRLSPIWNNHKKNQHNNFFAAYYGHP